MKPNPIALVIDNDRANRRLLRLLLESEHYRFIEAGDGKDGLSAAGNCHPDLIILEWLLPDLAGPVLLKRLRLLTACRFLVLSSNDREIDVVAALDSGADGYVIKPFSETELLARLRVLLRICGGEAYEPVLSRQGLKIDLIRHEVIMDGHDLDLTPMEAALLHVLLSYAGEIISVGHLLRSVWGLDGSNYGQNLRVLVFGLRRKLQKTKDAVIIETVESLGYRLWLTRKSGVMPPTNCSLS